MPNFDVESDNGTLPPGEISRPATERMLEVTGTAPERGGLAKQDSIRQRAFMDIIESTKPRTKWKHAEIRRLATQDQWDYAERVGHLDVGTVCAVGNLLLKGMSPTATRKALGITPHIWNTWYGKGQGADTQTGDDDALPQAPYNVFSFIVDHSQAVMELRAVQGWIGHFDRDWKASQAYLVARNPDEWNPVNKSAIDTTTKVDHVVTAVHDTTGLLEVAAILARAGALPKAVATAEVIEAEVIEPSPQRRESPQAPSPETDDR